MKEKSLSFLGKSLYNTFKVNRGVLRIAPLYICNQDFLESFIYP